MSVSYQLPDGATMAFDQPASALDIAERISKKLAKQALAAKVDGKLMDVYLPIDDGATVEIITRDTDDGLELIRHDAAHVMAEAVQELFPGTQVTIGPTIENGFYYDFYREDSFTPEDLKSIEKRMMEIVRRNEEIRREVWDRDEAIDFFLKAGEEFKAEIIRDLPANQEVSLYRQGDFIDLCRGPHLPSTSKLGDGFKLMKVAGAYWRGDASKAQLQRIYGTAWRDKKELNAYLKQLEEAEKRDHRKLAREMGLFHIQQEAVGSMFWHPKGFMIWRQLEAYIRRAQDVLALVGGIGHVMQPAIAAAVFLGTGQVIGLVVDREPASADPPVVQLDVFRHARPQAGLHEAAEFGDILGQQVQVVDPSRGRPGEGRGGVLQCRLVFALGLVPAGVIVDLEDMAEGVFEPEGAAMAQIAFDPAVGLVA